MFITSYIYSSFLEKISWCHGHGQYIPGQQWGRECVPREAGRVLAGGGEASRAHQPRIRTYAQDWQSKAGSRDGATERGKKLKATRAGIAGGRSSQAGQLRTAAAPILCTWSSIRRRWRGTICASRARFGGPAGKHPLHGSPLTAVYFQCQSSPSRFRYSSILQISKWSTEFP